MPPDKLSNHLIFQMARTAHASLHTANGKLEEAGRLSMSLQRILFHVNLSPHTTQGDLASRLGHTRAAISRQVTLLEEGGYLQGTPGTDRRRIILALTDKGRTEMEAALDILVPVLDERLALLTTREQETLRTLVAKLCPPSC